MKKVILLNLIFSMIFIFDKTIVSLTPFPGTSTSKSYWHNMYKWQIMYKYCKFWPGLFVCNLMHGYLLKFWFFNFFLTHIWTSKCERNSMIQYCNKYCKTYNIYYNFAFVFTEVITQKNAKIEKKSFFSNHVYYCSNIEL